MGWFIDGGNGVSAEDQEKLDKWTYDEQENRMSTDASVRSGLNSFELGEMHTTHSGGENVFDQNNVSGINWFPVWQGVKPLPASPVGKHIGLSPTVRQYGTLFELEPNGSTQFPEGVAYRDEITLINNESVMSLHIKAGETYSGELTYTIRDATQAGLIKYKQSVVVDVNMLDDVTFAFTHPSESMSGDVIAVNIVKEDGTDFLVARNGASQVPYLKLTLANFKDIPVVSSTQYITESFTVRYAGDFEVNTVSGAVTITVPSDFKETFYVSDAAQSFSPLKPCTVSFGGTQGDAVLQASRDAYKFYYDSVNSEWRFKDLDTKNGGVV